MLDTCPLWPLLTVICLRREQDPDWVTDTVRSAVGHQAARLGEERTAIPVGHPKRNESE